ncbi:helix-turn-helix domain-containing protein [Citrobacter koseri]|uniref:winged helix-turn-helix domain-containing protein n=1 Tax=Citrobacter koseri TaxID=545 RepID=UPI001900403F|nr:helix-turn-helix domain-containing protein [Citrobacter koseri]MBJ8986872.1 helix-turn-helix domain-containing protein [Citrobacter koseri]MBJ9011635.1 helix-turn-helix domain-containing protein [Citrobacter koseri]
MDYIINKILSYNSDERSIINIDAPDIEPIVLTPVLNRIFLVLITHHGELVTREQFLQNVWDDHGKSGSSNTLNQYIGALRKILEHQLGVECIITIPKQGYILSSALTIEENFIIKIPDTINELRNINYKLMLINKINKLAMTYRVLIASSLLVLILLSGLYFIYTKILSKPFLNSEMTLFYEINSCKIYIKKASIQSTNKDSIIHDINKTFNKNELACKENDSVYLFTDQSIRKESNGSFMMVSLCNNIQPHDSTCFSYRFNRY